MHPSIPAGSAADLTECVDVAELWVALGAGLARHLGLTLGARGLVAVGQAQGGVGPLHGAGVDVGGGGAGGGGDVVVVDDDGRRHAGLAADPHGAQEPAARGAQHGCTKGGEGGG